MSAKERAEHELERLRELTRKRDKSRLQREQYLYQLDIVLQVWSKERRK